MVAALCVPDVQETFFFFLFFFLLTTLLVQKIQNLIKRTFFFCVSIHLALISTLPSKKSVNVINRQ